MECSERKRQSSSRKCKFLEMRNCWQNWQERDFNCSATSGNWWPRWKFVHYLDRKDQSLRNKKRSYVFFFIAKLADSISIVAFWQAKNANFGMNCALEGLEFSPLVNHILPHQIFFLPWWSKSLNIGIHLIFASLVEGPIQNHFNILHLQLSNYNVHKIK